MLDLIKIQMTGHIAVQQCASGDHFGIQPSVFGDMAMELTAMPIGPVHHGGDGYSTIGQIVFFPFICAHS